MKHDDVIEFSFFTGHQSKKIVEQTNLNLLNKQVMHCSFYRELRYCKHSPSKMGLDFLAIGLMVAYIDKNCLRVDSYDSWSRNINATFSVLKIKEWNAQKTILEEMLSFLSGDYWTITFVQREMTNIEENIFKKRRKQSKNYSPSSICMFSGGLDSLIGAINILEMNRGKRCTAFINIAGHGNSETSNYDTLKKNLMMEYSYPTELFHSYGVTPSNRGMAETTTRARSFMFFTHAIALSTCYDGITKLIIPENGFISLNVPLTTARYGSASTRTTHPHYFGLLQKMIFELGIDLKIINPFVFKTKGEMVKECKNASFLKDNIGHSMSCSHPTSSRYKGFGHSRHCGHCLPCIIRMSSEYAAFGELITQYAESDEGNLTREAASTYRCMHLRIASLPSANLVTEVCKSGPIHYNLSQHIDIYKRGMREVETYLAKRAADN